MSDGVAVDPILTAYGVVLVIGFAAVGGGVGLAVGLLTAIAAVTVGAPAAVALGVFGSALGVPLAADPLGWGIRAGLLGGLVAIGVWRARGTVGAAGVTIASAAVLVGLTSAAVTLWGPVVAAAVPVLTGVVLLYALHRVELVTLGLVGDGGGSSDG